MVGLRELSTDEIKDIIDQAIMLGCIRWSISGGEPMLRSDFEDVFDYITRRSLTYSLNTNGTLITPRIARLMKRKGAKMVALYGATSKVHDHITRTPGSFEATMRGFRYLREAGSDFIVQIIPMKDNYHQFKDMVKLAESISPYYRVGASWLYLSACGSRERNVEIDQQRLEPIEVIKLNPQDQFGDQQLFDEQCLNSPSDDRLFANCIAARRKFHIDPYGGMTFCGFIKDSGLIYDLRKGTFQEAWETFIPSLADKIRGGTEYLNNCAFCRLKKECVWCSAFSYLEHRRHGAKIEYLCNMAQESHAFKLKWITDHRRYYQIAGITIQVDSELPINDYTFDSKFESFRVAERDKDIVCIQHHFGLPDINGYSLGKEVYRKPPWAIYRHGQLWIYLGIDPDPGNSNLHCIACFNDDHTRARIFNDADRRELFLGGGLHSLTLFPTDQILLARILADRQGCYLHSGAVVLGGHGLLFMGHSGAGKSTMIKMLKDEGEILCDDRNIVRLWPDGFRVHGTWSHGEVPLVSSASGPLRAMLLLRKSDRNRITEIGDRKKAIDLVLSCLIKPFVTTDWWQKNLSLTELMVREVPCYEVEFDKSGKIVRELKRLL